MQSICHVNRGLIRGRRRNCFHLIFIFVSVFISTQIQFSTHGRHAACRRRLLRLPQFHLVYFFTYARACVCIRMFTLLHRIRRKMKIFSYFFLSLRLLLVENLFNGTFSQYFHSLFPFAVWFIQEFSICNFHSAFDLSTTKQLILYNIYYIKKPHWNYSSTFLTFSFETCRRSSTHSERSSATEMRVENFPGTTRVHSRCCFTSDKLSAEGENWKHYIFP